MFNNCKNKLLNSIFISRLNNFLDHKLVAILTISSQKFKLTLLLLIEINFYLTK